MFGTSLPIHPFVNFASKNRKKVISGDRGGQGVGPSRPIHPFGYFALKTEKKLYPVIVVARVSEHLSQSIRLEILHPKTDEHVNPSVEVHHLFGKLSSAEIPLTEVQSKVFL